MFDDTVYKEVMEDICHFFKYGILPEIIGKWYTRKPVADSSGIVTTPTVGSAQANEDTVQLHAPKQVRKYYNYT